MTSCDSPRARIRKYFLGNEWYISGEVFLRNDSTVSPKYYDLTQGKFVGDTAFPIILTDSIIIYKMVREKGVYSNGRNFVITGDSIYTDTAVYDFIYINNEPRMILYLSSYPKICVPKKKIRPKPTQNYVRENFEINGYSIGDVISRDLLRVRGLYSYDTYTIEDCELKDNKDIKIKIIGYNQIYSIERHNIPNYRVQEAVKVINSKLDVTPEYFPMKKIKDDSDYEYEFYRWNAKGVTIKLERRRYVGSELYRNLLESDKWVLYYDDDVQRAILIEQNRIAQPKSTIIN